MKAARCVRMLAAALLAAALQGCCQVQVDRDALFQTSTLSALLDGVYDGQMAYRDVTEHGDFGIGTFDALDGEMIELGGTVYQIKADGKASRVGGSVKTPFAMVTFFEPDQTVHLEGAFDYERLMERLDELLPTENIFYAIRIAGDFEHVKTRSVPRQDRPYRRLVEVVKDQPTFEFSNVRGTMAGFRLPGYMAGLNVAGYHLHFLTEDGRRGGHVLEFSTQTVRIDVDYTARFVMALPDSPAFREADLTGGKQAEVEMIEK